MILDYYKILQVHYDASPEVIQSAYKRLSRKYHPDSNNNQDQKMKLINIAFEVLGNTQKRSEYHKEWIENFAPNAVTKYSNPARTANEQAFDVIDDYFLSLKTEDWENAYLKLTVEDKERISLEEFTDCKIAIAKCFQLQYYKIDFFKTYFNCTIENILYEKIVEYAVTVTDLNLKTFEISTEVVRKYVCFNGISWYLHFGQSSLKNTTLRFTLLSEKTEHFDPLSIYERAVQRYDNLTGLLSEKGFYEEAEKEVDRNRRYNNPFSLIALRIICLENVPETICVSHAANVLKRNLRMNDIAAKFGSNHLVCLLAETTREGAVVCLQKIVDLCMSTQNQKYELGTGIAEYSVSSTLDSLVYEICSESSYYDNVIIDNNSNSF